ncbi:MAG: 60S ribosomal protein L31 [Thaumarchaeota archaeon]|nr:60S ribosomal protein L31 [Nitrososphaerota archaeon]
MSEETTERIYTINLGKVMLSPTNQRAKRAINMIRTFASKHMKSESVKIEEEISHLVWERGIRHPPRKIRVKLSKDDDGNILVSKYQEERKAGEEKPKKDAKKTEEKKAAEEKPKEEKKAEEKPKPEVTAEEKPKKDAKKTEEKKAAEEKPKEEKKAEEKPKPEGKKAEEKSTKEEKKPEKAAKKPKE